MEQILINGAPVPVPAEVVTEGRLAVQAWHRQQLAAPVDGDGKSLPAIAHRVFSNGDPVELPAALVGKPKADVDAWAADEEKRRTDPVAFAAELAQRAKSKAPASPIAAAPASTPVSSSKE